MEHLVKNTGAGIVKGTAAEFVLRIDIFYLDFKLKNIITVLQFTGRCVDYIIISGPDRVSGIIIPDCIKSEIFKSLIIDGIFFRAGCVNVVIQIRLIINQIYRCKFIGKLHRIIGRQVHFAFIFRHDALFSGLYHTGFKLVTINFDLSAYQNSTA